MSQQITLIIALYYITLELYIPWYVVFVAVTTSGVHGNPLHPPRMMNPGHGLHISRLWLVGKSRRVDIEL